MSLRNFGCSLTAPRDRQAIRTRNQAGYLARRSGLVLARRHLPESGHEIVCVHKDSSGQLRVSRIGEHESSPLEAWDWHYRVTPPADH